jgi:GT2 family glycosyltransferase
MGEDYSWCENARLSGYRIWVDPAVKVKHHKETVFVL